MISRAGETVMTAFRNTRQRMAGEREAKAQPAIEIFDATGSTWRDRAFTAGALRTMNFKAIEYVVPGIIPEGLTILAGKPKIGKSWLALDLALAVAGDRFVLGELKPAQGDVLYAALEDNQRRLWKRTRKIMDTAQAVWPERLTLATQWRRIDGGGIEDIKDWASRATNPRLVMRRIALDYDRLAKLAEVQLIREAIDRNT